MPHFKPKKLPAEVTKKVRRHLKNSPGFKHSINSDSERPRSCFFFPRCETRFPQGFSYGRGQPPREGRQLSSWLRATQEFFLNRRNLLPPSTSLIMLPIGGGGGASASPVWLASRLHWEAGGRTPTAVSMECPSSPSFRPSFRALHSGRPMPVALSVVGLLWLSAGAGAQAHRVSFCLPWEVSHPREVVGGGGYGTPPLAGWRVNT